MSFPVFPGTVNIFWAFGGNAYSASNVYAIPQRMDFNQQSDKATYQDDRGNTIAPVYFNPHDDWSFEYLTTDSNTAAGNAAISSIPVGTMFSVTGGATAGPVTGSNWIVDNNSFAFTNTDALKITLKASRYPLVVA